MGCMLRLVVVLVLIAAAKAAPVQLANDGPAPDVIGLYLGRGGFGSVVSDGSFSFQASDSAASTVVGQYYSYECIGDGTGYHANYFVYTSGADGQFNTTAYCETGSVNNGLYTFTSAATEECPLSSTTPNITEYFTQVPGSSLGALLGSPFCTSSRNGVLDFPISGS